MSQVLPHQTQCSVEVIIRLQPPQSEHLQLIDQNTLYCINKQYFFDFIFPHHTTQQQIYEQVGLKMIASARKGYNSCIFVYGQTGSGKTYTMTGTEKQDGLIQNCMKNLLKMLQSFESYQLKLSYFQIYNEQVNDLLAHNYTAKKKQKNIKIKQSLTLGFYLENLQEIKIQNEIDLIQNLEKGIKNRTTAQTKMNKQSSRSHSILTLAVNTRQRKQNGLNYSIKSFKMHFVDLAGSQKQKSTLTAGQRLKQASNINKSLTSLSIVIQKLSSKATHIPYRDSVLTKILRDSLGGNSKTILIATLSSKVQSISQTISTLNFAVKAKKVKQSVRINQQYEGSAIEMRRRIEQLQHQIRCLRQKQPSKCTSCEMQQEEIARLQEQVERMQNIIKQRQGKITSLEQLVTNVEIQYENKLTQSLNKLQELQNISLVQCTSNQSSYYSFNGSIVDFLQQDNSQQDKTTQQQQCTIIDEAQYNESCESYLPKFGKGLSVIMEQNAQNQMSSISPPTHQENTQPEENKLKHKKRSRLNKINWDQSSVLSKPESEYQLKLQYIRCLKIIKNLKQQAIILERGIWDKNQELLKKHRQQIRKQSVQRQIYQPIIKKWIETNGSTIKTNLKTRNSIEGDIIMGMKEVINKLRATIDQSKIAAEQKDKSYKKAIEQITKVNNEYNSDILKYRQHFTNDVNQNNDIQNSSFCISNLGEEQNHNGYLSKSHPRIRNSVKLANNITEININNTNPKRPATQGMQQELGINKQNTNLKNFKSNNKLNCTIRSAPEQKQTPKQKPQQRIQNLQQQLDKQQVVKEQLTRQVENYKSRWQQLETQAQQNRELAQYWQNQYTNLCKTYKNVQLRLEREKQEKQRELENMKIKKEEIDNITKSYINCLKDNQQKTYGLQKYYQQREQGYKNQIIVLENAQINYQLQIQRDKQSMMLLENKVSTLSNKNYNLSQQVQKLRSSNQKLDQKYNMVCIQKQALSKDLNKQTVELRINRQNLKAMKQQYQYKIKQMQTQMRKIQKQNEKNYKQWLQGRDINKMLLIDCNSLKQQNSQVKRKYNMLVAKNEDLNRVMVEIQSEQYTRIQKLNNQNRELFKKSNNYSDLENQFKDKTEQAKHWKQKYEETKKWEQNFKIMQQQFINNQKQVRESEKLRLNTSQTSSNKESLQKQLQNFQLTKLTKEIVSKLSVVCGIQINQNNIIMNLNKIRDKIQQMRVVQAENQKFQRQFIQTRDRNSGSFNWGHFS